MQRLVRRLTHSSDFWQDFLEKDAKQLPAFGAAPILRQFGHERVVAVRTTLSRSIRRRDISSEMS